MRRHLEQRQGTVGRLTRGLVDRCRELTLQIKDLTASSGQRPGVAHQALLDEIR